MNKSFDSKAEFTLIHNPGYDFLRLVDWMQESETDPSSSVIAPYFFPVLALLGACFAIEGYINLVGQKKVSEWNEFDKGRVTIKAKIEKIYSVLDKPIDFNQGTWQKVILIFSMRAKLAHPRFIDGKEIHQQEVPDVFEILAEQYSSSVSKSIAEDVIDTLLNDSNLSKFRHFVRFKTYHGPPRSQF